MHYGDSDLIVPVPDIEKIRAAHPEVTIHLHPGAGHAQNNQQNGASGSTHIAHHQRRSRGHNWRH